MSTPSRFLIFPTEPIAEINPYLHGQFAEHLGELIYPGIFVDQGSKVANTAGIRHDVVEALKPLGVSVLRWPGGCFADTYHWRDGIGPVASRKKRVNVHWGMATESNHFGTHEFMAFCRSIGAEAYFAANLGSAPPAETRDWIEYCNFGGDSTLANERRANGQDEPFGVKFWGIGNENWGCGGNMSPTQYAGEYSKYQTFAFNYPGAPITKIACGPCDSNWNWTTRFLSALAESGHLRTVGGLAAHYYAGTAGTATQYTESQWLELLSKAVAIEGIITGHRAIMDDFDPNREIKLLLDEWGTWHPVQTGKPTGGLYQQNTIRDACVAGLTLDIFHNHADKLYMANIAQLINVLQSLLLVDENSCVKTPTYHVFDLYRSHKGATAVRSVAEADIISHGEASEGRCKNQYRDHVFSGLGRFQGSASIRGNVLCATLVNAHPTEPVELEIAVKNAAVEFADVVTLAAPDIHDHNTAEEPNRVTLTASGKISGTNGVLRVALAPASVNRFLCELT
ncbi:MAG: alpha-L-arabinofuranosidase C-terminal domain-containing protein [Capsulimonadaceae bacterium]|nr:alpha-L-arabinofuranosidase C-terminal domain-containing protein [Capsulimonadaceae bacterium]